jgi:hypothetical protein
MGWTAVEKEVDDPFGFGGEVRLPRRERVRGIRGASIFCQ